MTLLLLRTIIAAVVIVAATEFGRRSPRLGGFILSLPLVSMLAMLMSINLQLAHAAHLGGRLVHQYGVRAILEDVAAEAGIPDPEAAEVD